jgi:hypothetical protein
MTVDQIQRRINLGRELIAGRIKTADAKKRLGCFLGLDADDIALMTVMMIEAEMLSEDPDVPADVGRKFSIFAQDLEDPMSSLRAALAAEAAANVEVAA